MKGTVLSVGFIPLVDAAPLIVAQEMGFAAEEGLALDLVRAPSWSSLRDMLVFGRVDAAHMLSPVPVATAMGLGGAGTDLAVLSILSVNGNVVGVSREREARLRNHGHDFAFDDAEAAGRALIACAGDLGYWDCAWFIARARRYFDLRRAGSCQRGVCMGRIPWEAARAGLLKNLFKVLNE